MVYPMQPQPNQKKRPNLQPSYETEEETSENETVTETETEVASEEETEAASKPKKTKRHKKSKTMIKVIEKIVNKAMKTLIKEILPQILIGMTQHLFPLQSAFLNSDEKTRVMTEKINNLIQNVTTDNETEASSDSEYESTNDLDETDPNSQETRKPDDQTNLTQTQPKEKGKWIPNPQRRRKKMVRRDPKELVVLQWNCKSINAPGRYTECDNLIKAIKPHIVLLSETWLHPDKNISKFKNYNTTYRKDRPAREGGGLLMLVRDDLRHRSLQVNPIVNSMIEAQAIEIYLAHDKVNILHVYNPEQTLDLEHLDPLVDRLGRKFLIAGDFNGRHTLWDPRTNHTNNCGNNLSQYIISHPNIALATPQA
ncbi:unnamed protein product [Meganyctiphanes norvegica]|uniref:Endonuclease/exonuclease/phosphatase domain-containing protein n=1 Tax=Meganyctiphanes norvegica TaxID=48144 RepID=A0AAV2QY72_MEGNR